MTLQKLAERLDRAKVVPPTYIYVPCPLFKAHALNLTREKQRETSVTLLINFSDLVKRLQDPYFEGGLKPIRHFLSELAESQDISLWNAFAKNGGEIHIYKDVDALEHANGKKRNNLNIEKDEFSKELRINYTIDYGANTQSTSADLHHEMGHWVDDMSYLTLQANPKGDIALGLHSLSPLWQTLKEWDTRLYSEKSASSIITETMTRRGYFSSVQRARKNDLSEEFFAIAAEFHYGNNAYLSYVSPLFRVYFDKMAALDISIMSSDKTMAEKQADRKKLFDALRKPLETYLDSEKIQSAINQLSATESVTKKAIIGTIEQSVAEGVDKLAKEVADEIGITFRAGAAVKVARKHG